MKKSFFLIVFYSILSFAQQGRVGINTINPQSTLDVSANRNSSTNLIENSQPIGLQAPRLTRAELTANTFSWSTSQRGALVYITDVSGGDTTGTRVNVTSVGYYYFDGSLWRRIIEQNSLTNIYNSDGDVAPTSGTPINRSVNFTGGGSLNFDQNTLFINATDNSVGLGTNAPNSNSILELASTNKALLLPRLTNTSSITSPTNGMMIYDSSSNCIKSYENGAWSSCLSSINNVTFAKIVYINTTSPSTATIFDINSPAASNDNSLKQDSNNLYVTTSGQTFIWNGSSYISYTVPATTPWLIAGTLIDAGADKTSTISRNGRVAIGKTAHTNGHALEVVSNMQVKDSSTAGSGQGYGIEINTNSTSPRVDFVFNGAYVGQFGSDTTDFWYRNSRANTGTHLWSTSQGGAQVNQMRLRNDGLLWLRNVPTISNAVKVVVLDPTTNDLKSADVSQIKRPTVKEVTGAYTITSSDEGSLIYVNSSTAVSITVPSMSAGFTCDIYQEGSGQVTLVNGSGNTLRSANGFKTRTQNSVISVSFKTSSMSNVTGDTAL